jgi:uncharacterized protein
LSAYFVDTSALAKRYTKETGTGWISSLVRVSTRNVIVIAELAQVEMFSVFARRELDGEIKKTQASYFRNTFLAHLRNSYAVIKLNSTLLTQSSTLVTKHAALRLRTLDAIQPSCALEAQKILGQSMTVVSADKRLLSSAAAEGFTVDNPNNHP